ncbi:flavodoxin family protein [Nocardiopsis gilva YIM 90087]|uniref:Flavodoxin family protein n=1 Tax=Nocardiopsis gilva YIM 90087 TaxID=1235441 RepID=A0A223SCG2_9ACTN|nr:NAD(P)H-dependent oxidoreductase [Nocardiopsis gilva]ASU85792.1 flavodoxin family protein [Nocardiopsis gilva YIM 90087]
MTESAQQPQKNVLIVTAHPEPRSLNAALADFAAEHLRAAGHEVRTSDLYAMKWKATLDADDYPDHPADQRLHVLDAAGRATAEGRLSPDITAEQEKLLWSDAVILQFPMWWFSVPGILKGWIDRVFTYGFAHGPGMPPPYSNGGLAPRRALASVTFGAHEPSFSDRGVHGRLKDVLFPLHHGLFWFTALAPLEPFAMYDVNEAPDDRFEPAKLEYADRLDHLFTDEPIPFRTLDGGDYDHDMRLLPDVQTAATSGPDIHLRPRG